MFLRELLCIQNKECLLPVLSDKSWAKWETDDETKQYQSITVYSLSLRLNTIWNFLEAHIFADFLPWVLLCGSFCLVPEARNKIRSKDPPMSLSAVNITMVIVGKKQAGRSVLPCSFLSCAGVMVSWWPLGRKVLELFRWLLSPDRSEKALDFL